jgi:hypothetical protein
MEAVSKPMINFPSKGDVYVARAVPEIMQVHDNWTSLREQGISFSKVTSRDHFKQLKPKTQSGTGDPDKRQKEF